MISLEILTPLQKFPKNVRDLGKKIAQSGHTASGGQSYKTLDDCNLQL